MNLNIGGVTSTSVFDTRRTCNDQLPWQWLTYLFIYLLSTCLETARPHCTSAYLLTQMHGEIGLYAKLERYKIIFDAQNHYCRTDGAYVSFKIKKDVLPMCFMF